MLAGKVLRPLDPGEAFFTLADQVSGMNFVVFAERSKPLPPEQVRAALDAVQREHVLLQTCIQWVNAQGLCFVQMPAVAIELRCPEVNQATWQNQIGQQLSEPFAMGTVPLVRCLLLNLLPDNDAKPPTSGLAVEPASGSAASVLALCFHHAIADGRSGTALLCRLLSLMASGELPPASERAETEARQDIAGMLSLHPLRYRWAEQPEAAKQLKATLIADYRRHGALTPIPWLTAHTRPSQPKFIRMCFEPEVTERLLRTARSHGSTVHGALCAAQLLAQQALQPGDDANVFCLSCPADMRPYLVPAPSVSPTGLYVSIVSSTFSIDDSTGFWDLARDVVTQTRRQLARGEGHLFFHMFGLDGAPLTPERVAPLHQKVLASLPNTMVSNIGIIAPIIEDPAVTAISFALCPMPYQTLFTAASTYHGQLVLNVGYDATRLSDVDAQALVDGISGRLIAAIA